MKLLTICAQRLLFLQTSADVRAGNVGVLPKKRINVIKKYIFQTAFFSRNKGKCREIAKKTTCFH